MEVSDLKGKELTLGEVTFRQNYFVLSVLILGRNSYPNHLFCEHLEVHLQLQSQRHSHMS